ncbi:hypothetical protein WDW89_19210 [Deltaproteobacteria bacterium TL4]
MSKLFKVELPDKIRNLFLLREMDGESSENLCETWGITLSNLHVLIYRARHQLRKCFEEFGVLGLSYPRGSSGTTD